MQILADAHISNLGYLCLHEVVVYKGFQLWL